MRISDWSSDVCSSDLESNVAVFTIDPAETRQSGRRGAPDRRGGALLRTLEVAPRIDNGRAVRMHRAKLLNLLPAQVTRKRSQYRTGMDGKGANAVLRAARVERDGEEGVCRLGLAVRQPFVVGAAPEIEI